MSITIIPNQPIRFQNEDDIDTSCDCLGQSFCQLINKNDNTQFQLESTTNLVTNGEFTDGLDGWTYDSTFYWDEDTLTAHFQPEQTNNPISFDGILEIGKYYVLIFDLDTQDVPDTGVVVDSFGDSTEYIESGTYTVIGFATSTDLIFNPIEGDNDEGDFMIDNIKIYEIPSITINDEDDNIVAEMESVVLTAEGTIINYEIDWTDLDDGCYHIAMSHLAIDYVSDCLSVKLEHDCTFLLSWTNDENAYGFDFADLSFTPKLRVEAKKWKPSYPKEKNVFKDNAGNRTVLKSETTKEEILTISEMPEYLHDALAIGLDHDTFMIDGVEYVNEETEYTPKWRNSSQLSPVEVVVIKDQFLRNNSC
jgi:hypothetical protein